MPHKTTHPHSVPAHLQGKTQKGFQGGKNKVLELLNNRTLKEFSRQLVQRVLPLESAKWFVLDCAKFTQLVFEKQYPKDKRLSNLIEVNESFLNSNSTLNQIKDACSEVLKCVAYAAADAETALSVAHTAACWSAPDAASDAACDADDYWCAKAALSTSFYAAVYAYDEHDLNDADDNYNIRPIALFIMAALYALDATSKDEMQAFIKNWIDQYFSNLPN